MFHYFSVQYPDFQRERRIRSVVKLLGMIFIARRGELYPSVNLGHNVGVFVYNATEIGTSTYLLACLGGCFDKLTAQLEVLGAISMVAWSPSSSPTPPDLPPQTP